MCFKGPQNITIGVQIGTPKVLLLQKEMWARCTYSNPASVSASLSKHQGLSFHPLGIMSPSWHRLARFSVTHSHEYSFICDVYKPVSTSVFSCVLVVCYMTYAGRLSCIQYIICSLRLSITAFCLGK